MVLLLCLEKRMNGYGKAGRGQALGCRPVIQFKGRHARILLDQIRSVDKVRLGKKMGEIPKSAWHSVLLDMLE